MATWTKETFQFISPQEPQDSTHSLKAEFDRLFDPIEVPEYLLPTWLPEHFTKIAEDGYESMSDIFYKFLYESDVSDQFVGISVSYILSNPTVIYEKDDGEVVIYQKDGIDYYMMSNLNTITAIWKYGSFECQISGDISWEDLKKMIDSIPPLE